MPDEPDGDAGPGAVGPAPDPFQRSDPPLLHVTLWPHRSLPRRGIPWVLGLVAAGLAIPLVPLAGTKAAWALLPFGVAALLGIYFALKRRYADARLTEELRLWPDLVTVVRREPRGRVLRWHANPFWVEIKLHEDARIEKYLTLRGNGREIELGAFLSPDERTALYRDLGQAFGRIRTGAPR